jgi:hypothetical protein
LTLPMTAPSHGSDIMEKKAANAYAPNPHGR